MNDMRKLIEAAFFPPPRTENDSTTFAVLPQSSQDELSLSEVHTKLDQALAFLQLDVGYALLDDARPHPGGGVRLLPLQRNLFGVPRGARSAKLPREEPSLSHPRSGSPLDDSAIVRLGSPLGELRPSDLVEEIRRRHGQNLPGGVDGHLARLERLLEGAAVNENCEITWQEFEALLADFCKAEGMSEDAREAVGLLTKVLQEAQKSLPTPLEEQELPIIGRELAKYAHYQCDLVLVSRFAHILCKGACQELDAQDGLSFEEQKSRIESSVKHNGLYKCVLQGVRLMHLCDYDYADVVLVLAYASVYFRSTFASIGKKISPNEAAHVVALLIYLAHAFLLDETCPLRIWQKHIFKKYCTLKVLDAALFRLFQMRPGFRLKVTYEEEKAALLGLSGLQYQARSPEDEAEEKELPKASNSSKDEKKISNGHDINSSSHHVNGATLPQHCGNSSSSNGHLHTNSNSLEDVVVAAPIVVDHRYRPQDHSKDAAHSPVDVTAVPLAVQTKSY